MTIDLSKEQALLLRQILWPHVFFSHSTDEVAASTRHQQELLKPILEQLREVRP